MTPADLTLLGLSLGALALVGVLVLILFEEG